MYTKEEKLFHQSHLKLVLLPQQTQRNPPNNQVDVEDLRPQTAPLLVYHGLTKTEVPLKKTLQEQRAGSSAFWWLAGITICPKTWIYKYSQTSRRIWQDHRLSTHSMWHGGWTVETLNPFFHWKEKNRNLKSRQPVIFICTFSQQWRPLWQLQLSRSPLCLFLMFI